MKAEFLKKLRRVSDVQLFLTMDLSYEQVKWRTAAPSLTYGEAFRREKRGEKKSFPPKNVPACEANSDMCSRQ